jgi:hypothetical protein
MNLGPSRPAAGQRCRSRRTGRRAVSAGREPVLPAVQQRQFALGRWPAGRPGRHLHPGAAEGLHRASRAGPRSRRPRSAGPAQSVRPARQVHPHRGVSGLPPVHRTSGPVRLRVSVSDSSCVRDPPGHDQRLEPPGKARSGRGAARCSPGSARSCRPAGVKAHQHAALGLAPRQRCPPARPRRRGQHTSAATRAASPCAVSALHTTSRFHFATKRSEACCNWQPPQARAWGRAASPGRGWA